MFLGYPPGYKGYKLLDLENDQVFISQNVQFHEMIFPFNKVSSTPDDIFYDRVLPRSHNHPFPSSNQSSTPCSTCVTRPPSHLVDYHCYLTSHNTSSCPLSNYLNYD